MNKTWTGEEQSSARYLRALLDGGLAQLAIRALSRASNQPSGSGVQIKGERVMVTAEGKPPCTYTVQSGDTLFDIAQANYGDGSQYQKIVDANKDQNVTPSTLMAGATINIPANASGTGSQTLPTDPVMDMKQGAPPTTHTVAAGDSLYGIAEAYYGDCRLWSAITAAFGRDP
jgi:nucleoid-associated protein YgaU